MEYKRTQAQSLATVRGFVLQLWHVVIVIVCLDGSKCMRPARELSPPSQVLSMYRGWPCARSMCITASSRMHGLGCPVASLAHACGPCVSATSPFAGALCFCTLEPFAFTLTLFRHQGMTAVTWYHRR